MAPLYEELCNELKWPIDQSLLAKMKKANEEKLKEFEEKLKFAEENLGETEVRDVLFSQAEYLCSIGNKVYM
jgi:26S proteasome regulatory subunit N7